MLLSQSYWYPNLSAGTDSISVQMYTDKVCPCNGLANYSRVWRRDA